MSRIVLIISFVFFQFQGMSQSSGTIPYDDDDPIEWSDFKRRTGGNGVYKAYTYSGIKYSIDRGENGMVRIDVEAYFVPKDSWVFTDFQNNYLLNHERRHFDITEIYARKMRKVFSEYIMPMREFWMRGHVDTIGDLFNDLYKEMERVQKSYDRETDHSLRKSIQAKWDEEIKSELDRLSEFAL